MTKNRVPRGAAPASPLRPGVRSQALPPRAVGQAASRGRRGAAVGSRVQLPAGGGHDRLDGDRDEECLLAGVRGDGFRGVARGGDGGAAKATERACQAGAEAVKGALTPGYAVR